MRYKGIIFDLDGVICSTDEYHYRAWKTLADRLGIPFDRERNNRLRGVSRMESLEIVLEKGGRTYTGEEKAAFAEEKNTLYRQLLAQMTPADLADGNCITRSKPDPEVFLKAAEMLGLAPADCLVAEDARAGVEAAVAGGFDCAAIGDARDDERARWHLNRFSDILKSLG